jgi:hypothetical protein
MARHRQKDAEAGAPGSGVLNTRKRMWKDSDGNIVTKRPHSSRQQHQHQLQQQRDQSQKLTSEHTPSLALFEIHTGHNRQGGVPISPPISTSNSYDRSYSDDQDAHTSQDDLWSLNPFNINTTIEPADIYQPAVEDRFWSGDLAAPLEPSPEEDVPYDDIFNPDTGISTFPSLSRGWYADSFMCNSGLLS